MMILSNMFGLEKESSKWKLEELLFEVLKDSRIEVCTKFIFIQCFFLHIITCDVDGWRSISASTDNVRSVECRYRFEIMNFLFKVREKASELFSGLVHYGFFKVTQTLLVSTCSWRFNRHKNFQKTLWFRKKFPNPSLIIYRPVSSVKMEICILP